MEKQKTNRKGLLLGLPVVGVVCVCIVIYSAMYTVDSGERGVVLRYGKVISVSEPGLHFKTPAIDKVVKIPTRTFTGELPNVLAYSEDQQPADMKVSVTLAVKSTGAEDLYIQFKDLKSAYENVVKPNINKAIKTVFGQFSAIEAVQERQKLNADAQNAVVEVLSPYEFLDIKSVQIENIDFSDAYEQTIEDRMKAEVEVERYKQNLERERVEAEIVVTKAQAQADAQVKAAEAEAKAISLKSTAEADAIQQKGKALSDNPQITALIQVEKWDGVLPKTILPNSAVPMLNIVEKH